MEPTKEAILAEAKRRAATKGLDWDTMIQKQRTNHVRKAKAVLSRPPQE